jgi:Fic family protein
MEMPPVRYHLGSFPPVNLDWPKLVPLLGPASAAIARYDGALGAVPNPMVLLSPLTTQEAVLSSKIEGTQATMGEVLEFEAGVKPDEKTRGAKTADIQEVINYRKAIAYASKQLKRLPLCQRMIKETHAILLEGVRGRNRAPGAYRRTQNWIGPVGCKEEEASYIPLSADRLTEAMSVWEKYLQSSQPDALVQLAVLPAEFEALHPFLDGNGRLGRMLIPLFLYERKILSSPTFYISAYFEGRRPEYYDRLLAVSRDGDWAGWCVFFLKALLAQGETNVEKVQVILRLYNDKKKLITEQTRSPHSMRALDFIFNRPIFNAADFIARAGIPESTAKRFLKALREKGVLKTLREPSGRRPAVLAFAELLNAVEGRKVI